MTSARVPWPLLLLLALAHQSWDAGAEKYYLQHPVSPSVLHSEHSELLHRDTREGNLVKVTVTRENVDESTDTDESAQLQSADFPCPDAAAIAPCVCSVDSTNNIDLNCTEVKSEGQLAAVFQQDFPVKQLHGFYMNHNDAIKVLGDILNGVTFEEIRLQPGPFVLQAVADQFFLNSKHTLRYFRVEKSNLLSDWFPFATLIAMDALDTLIINYCNFTTLPKLYSPMISVLVLNTGLIDAIRPGTFDDAERIEHLSVQHHLIEELKAGTILIREGEMILRINYNDHLRVIEPGTFFFSDANSANSNLGILIFLDVNQLQSLQAGTIPFRNAPSMLWLSDNLISSLEPGTFVLPNATGSFSLELHLHNNRLTTFDEAVFGDLMPFVTGLWLHGNPLICECDIAWLVLNPAYMSVIDDNAACDDGTLLQNLDPQAFEDFCFYATLGDN